ncbi:MAG: HlyD family efflux transporter periplasmic adaptor subunit [Mucilaginibacter sp.]|jgi:multidrug resistance efflux pump|nr:HlyD family efflux transporter periplasmic adaptor subunit [Mucilaginibacter sp.]
MSQIEVNKLTESRHSDDIQDIISASPPWLLRWGITLFFMIIMLILGLSAFIKYPDIIKTQLKITSLDAPKSIVAKVSGKLSTLLVVNDQTVMTDQPLGYLESTANHKDVLDLIEQLRQLQQQELTGKPITDWVFSKKSNYNFGELQVAYQTFIQNFLDYLATINSGVFIKRKAFLQQDLINLQKQAKQLTVQKSLQQHDFKLAAEEYEMHKNLALEDAETKAELRGAESNYLNKQSPLVQIDASIIASASNYAAKQKEILELDNQMIEEKTKFMQALNSLISQAEEWKGKYVLTASQPGKVSLAGNIQKNQVLQSGQDVFYINPGSDNFFGEMAIPQINMGKVKTKQVVLIKLKSYPFEEYGMIRGQINTIDDVPYRDSIFLSKVDFIQKKGTDFKKEIHLKQGMLADAEIITENATLLQRITRNLFKLIDNDRN